MLGPIHNKQQFEKLQSLLQECVDDGLTFLYRGEPIEEEGYFMPLHILDNPPESAAVVRLEQFGPILPLMKYDDVDALIERVNDSEYGLGATVWSQDIDEANRIAGRLNVGSVWINEIQHLSSFAAFSGHKQSGIGQEGGVRGILEYTKAKTISRSRKPEFI